MDEPTSSSTPGLDGKSCTMQANLIGRLKPGCLLGRFSRINIPAIGDWAACCAGSAPPRSSRAVRRAQRREARLGIVDGGREAAEARENDAPSPGAAATWTLTSFTLRAMIWPVAAGGGDALAGPQVDGPMTRKRCPIPIDRLHEG